VFGIAILWATVHSNAWPSPVPLFFLGLVLGWLARRTGSLVGPITLHALFNAIAAVQLALS
jgi:membrane protease YdiL (CAAX protease family)